MKLKSGLKNIIMKLMEKKFKHKTLGIVGTLKEDGHLHFERGMKSVSHMKLFGEDL